jgi:hypothetical protein
MKTDYSFNRAGGNLTMRKQKIRSQTIRSQIKNNFVAIVSLVVAFIALTHDAWRNELTEKNRNIRMAGFELLKNLGELQIIVNHAYYSPDSTLGNPYLGWGHVLLISDLSELLPSNVTKTVGKLTKVWGENWEKIKKDETAVSNISTAIDDSRKEVLQTIRQLK